MVLPVKGLGKINKASQHCCWFRTVLMIEDEVQEFNEVVADRVPLGSSILTEIHFASNIFKEPWHDKLLQDLAEKWCQCYGSEVIFTQGYWDFSNRGNILHLPLLWPGGWLNYVVEIWKSCLIEIFASGCVTKSIITRSIFKIEGSSFGFSLIFMGFKNHVLQLRLSDQLSKFSFF